MINEDSFTFPFKTREWGSKFLIGSLLLLLSYVIPVIPLIFVLGYVIRGMQYTIRTGEKRLAEWDDWTDLGLKGILYILVYFIYLLPGLVFLAGGIGTAGIGIILQSSGDGSVALPLLVLAKVALVCSIVILLAAALLLLIGALMAPIAVARLAATGEMAAALEVDRVLAIIRSQIGEFFLVWALSVALGYVASMIYGILYYTACCCILIPILAAPIGLYIMIFSMTLFAQVYRQGESVTSGAPLLLPEKTRGEERSRAGDETGSEKSMTRDESSGTDEISQTAETVDSRHPPASSHELPLSYLDLPARAERVLLENGFVTVGQVLQSLEKDDQDLLAIKGFGAKSLEELKSQLRGKGFPA